MKICVWSVFALASFLLIAGCSEPQEPAPGATPSSNQAVSPSAAAEEPGRAAAGPQSAEAGAPSSDRGPATAGQPGEGKHRVLGAVGKALFKAAGGGTEEGAEEQAPQYERR